MKLYRYEAHNLENVVELTLLEFKVVKETKCGYWFVPSWCHIDNTGYHKWVSKSSIKRYCYTNKDEAFSSFQHRAKWRLRYVKRSLMVAEHAIKLTRESPKIEKPDKFKFTCQ